MKIILRPHHLTKLDEKVFQALTEKLISTLYKAGATDADAPDHTDCVTAVRYIFRYSSDFVLPHAYIGDMPKILIDDGLCMIHSLQEVQRGDLVFFEKMSHTHRKYMVAHVGIMLDRETFFHSSLTYDGAISRIDDKEYINSILEESFLSIARDPRNHD